MFFLSLAITLLIGYFLPQWMYDLQWSTLIKIATQTGKLETLNELGDLLLISQETGVKYIITIAGICLLIFIICMSVTRLIRKAVKKKN